MGTLLLYCYFHMYLTFQSQKRYCCQLLNAPFPHDVKMQVIMEKSIVKGQFAHKGTVRKWYKECYKFFILFSFYF
jgi:hypothetical protein